MAKLNEKQVKDVKGSLEKEANKKDIKNKGGYVFGTLRKLGWKPKAEQK